MYRTAARRGLSTITRHSPSRSPSPPQSTASDDVYVLTLQTDATLHADMTRLRNCYFPPALNKLEAHLTLFHALPGARLRSTIVPDLEALAARTDTFSLTADRVFRLRRGIAVNVVAERRQTRGDGGNDQIDEASALHEALRQPWAGSDKDETGGSRGFLTKQDAKPRRLHFTIMNKVDNEDEVARAFESLKHSWTVRRGHATGLGLWRYDGGNWSWEREFAFQAAPMT